MLHETSEYGSPEAGPTPPETAFALPSGGGAIRSLGEQVRANPATGTATLSVPLPLSPARALTPALALAYDSGAGASPFGLGWSVAVPSITRRGARRLPSWDADDLFTLTGAEDLVPERDTAGAPMVRDHTEDGAAYRIARYRPRTVAGHARIEHWEQRATGESHWRVWGADNTVSVFGPTADTRIADPDDPSRVFRWMLARRYDAFGHLVVWSYKREDDAGVDPLAPHEAHRAGRPLAALYPKTVRYGNRMPFDGVLPAADGFCFTLLFDYGEHATPVPDLAEVRPWPVREDPISSHRAGFEVRESRLCRRVVMLHHIAALGPDPVPVRAVELAHVPAANGLSLLDGVRAVGYRPDDAGAWTVETMPWQRFGYQAPTWTAAARPVTDEAGRALPAGPGQSGRIWRDLYGEGLPGCLGEAGRGFVYRRNLGGGRLGEAEPLPVAPTLSGLETGITVADLAGEGRTALMVRDGPVAGYAVLDRTETFAPFRPFPRQPTGGVTGPGRRLVDLDGDGRADLLACDGEVFHWYPGLGRDGFGPPRRLSFPVADAHRTAVVLDDPQGRTLLADMTGDGLTDLVRVEPGRVRYWPGLGRGRFGAPVTMADAPRLAPPDTFDPARLTLADLDGSGAADLLYLGPDTVTIWLNRAGNGFAAPVVLPSPFPSHAAPDRIELTDVTGCGLAALVWSAGTGRDGAAPLRYLQPAGDAKPYLMTRHENGLGGEVRLEYAPSTRFERADRAAGRPWITRPPYPIHCLARMERIDHVTGLRLTSVYAYRHGWVCPHDREFRGFARVDQTDTEAATGPRAWVQPPVVTRRWYHTGAAPDGLPLADLLAAEQYRHPALPEPEASVTLPEGLSSRDWREAQRALRGALLREEVYALDGGPQAAHPFTITHSQWRLALRQPSHGHDATRDWAVFQRMEAGRLTVTLDRVPDDARVSQSLVLAWDGFGRPVREATVGFPRPAPPPDLPDSVRAAQTRTTVVLTETDRTDAVLADDTPAPTHLWGHDAGRHLPRPVESRVWGVEGLALSAPVTAGALDAAIAAAAEIDPADDPPPDRATRRLLRRSRRRYLADDLSGPLPLGRCGRLGLTWRTETLAFTPALLTALYGDRVGPDETAAAGYEHSAGVDGTPDAGLWAVSGTPVHDAGAADRFYVPDGQRDPFGAVTRVWRDDDGLLPVRRRDPLGQESVAVNDYRVLEPRAVRDVNGAWQAVRRDALGRVVAVARMGTLPGIDAPRGDEIGPDGGDTLDRPGTVHAYDLHAWVRDGQPARATTTVFDRHGPGPRGQLMRHAYSDGFGTVVMTKAQAAPGSCRRIGPDGALEEVDTATLDPPAPRWIANGRTLRNNKGQPVRTHEPYFTDHPGYDDDPRLVETGPSRLDFYDAAGRAVGALAADGRWSKLRIGPWLTEHWDAGDTAGIAEPTADDVLGAHFAGLEGDGPAPADGASADGASAAYADTPARSHTDARGRTVRTEVLAEAGGAPLGTDTILDIEGNTRAVIDARGVTVLRARYDLRPPPDDETPKPALRQDGPDTGTRRSLPDVLGRPFLAWDARGHRLREGHDALGRPVATWLSVAGGPEVCVARTDYGENLDPAEAARRNLLGAVWRRWDQAGLTETEARDFKGNTLATVRRLARPRETDAPLDWPEADAGRLALLEPEAWRSAATYDGLDRVTERVAPHMPGRAESRTRPHYDTGGRLDRVEVVTPDGALRTMLAGLEHDARGLRQTLRLGNGVETRHAYDPLTVRLTGLTTTRPSDGARLQDLRFTYDAVGNIVEQADDAQQAVFFSGAVAAPRATYRYDALYRLVEATGREHIDQTGGPAWRRGREAQAHPQDGTRLRPYTQHFEYDAVGNITRIRHVAPQGGAGWTRTFTYAADSNRLSESRVGDDAPPETFAHNAHGSLTVMPHLPALAWDFAERLSMTDRGAGDVTWYVHDADGTRVRKRRVLPDGRVRERLYLGDLEIWREYAPSGLLERERETLHVGDDSGRIALVETLTVEQGAAVAPAPLVRHQIGDHLGSAVLELDGDGAVISFEAFHPYGTTAIHTVAPGREVPAKRYRYTGRERDEETGLGHHGARYYAPWLARWTAADPIGLGDGVNVYAYVGGRPVGSVDPGGLAEGVPQTLETEDPYGVCEPIATPDSLVLSSGYARAPSFGLPPPTEGTASGAKGGDDTPSYSALDLLATRFLGIYAILYGLTWAAGDQDMAAGAVDEFSFYGTFEMRSRHFPEYHKGIDYQGGEYYTGTWIGYGAQTTAFAVAGGGTVGVGRAVAGSMVDDAAFAVILHEEEAWAAGGGGGGGGGGLKRPLLSALWAVDIGDSLDAVTKPARGRSGGTLVRMPIERADGRVQDYWVRSSSPMRSTSTAAERLATNQANGYALAYAKWATFRMYGFEALWEVRMFGGARRMDIVLPPQRHVPRWTGFEVKHGMSWYGGRQMMWDSIARDQAGWDIFVSRGTVIYE
jgi:RHS repeat-associated protein